MDEKELKSMIEKDESETAEFKKSTAQLEKALKAVCGFLNNKGGAVYFGIDKKKIIGQDVSEQTLKSISQKIRQRIKPEVSPDIRVLELEGKKIIEAKIKEGNNKPYYLDGIAYNRVGSENVAIPPDELERIILEKKKVYWDGQVCDATMEDIDWDFIEKSFIPLYEKISESHIAGNSADLLNSLGCIKNNKPTNAGILLFGKDPQKFFMNSYIVLARYPGSEIYGEKLDYKEFKGNLFQQIDSCRDYIIEHTALMSRLIPGEIRREDIPEYGLFSIRELITNAVCHRDYQEQGSRIIIKMFDDRIEFFNIGGLPSWITPENITSEQYSRNPAIAKVLAKVKYIEELGEGWDKIIKENKEHYLKPKMPEIKSSENSTFVTLFSTKEKFEKEKPKYILNERQKKSLQYIKNKGRIDNKTYVCEYKVSSATAKRELRDMVGKGILKQFGRGRAIYYIST